MQKFLSSPVLQFPVRVLIGLIFVVASIDKIAAPDAFAASIEAYHLVPGSIINLMAIIVPWMELFIGMSRAATAVSSVLNQSQLLSHIPNEFRGRVFSTIETMNWSTMMVSMAIAGGVSDFVSPRTIGAWAGVLSSCTAVFWGWANWRGRLPEPPRAGVEPEEVEVHGDPKI